MKTLNFFKKNRLLNLHGYIALIAFLGIVLFLAFRFFIPSLRGYAEYPLYAVLLLGGTPLVLELILKVFHLQFGSDLIAGISIITAIFLEQNLAGSLVILMLSGGQTLENYALRTASKVLEALAKRSPTMAHRKREQVEEIAVEEIEIGDTLVIYPHEICPVDGIVVEGRGEMDESYLTGEPFLLSKAPGSSVLSGAINGSSAVTIRATKISADSRFAKIMKVMQESEQKRPKIRRLADQLGAWYTPIAIFIALIAWLASGEAVRFLAVLVIATPCPLILAIPVAIIGSISLCARLGILIKDPVVLEQFDQCKTIIFDKTGTLTYGKPVLTEQTVLSTMNSRKILQLAASLEVYSKHPLAHAVLEKAAEEKLSLLDVKQISEIQGVGLQGFIDGHEVVLTGRKHVNKELPSGTGLECVILIDNTLAALYRFRDMPRTESFSFISHLKPKHEVEKIMIVSGDREEEVKYTAEQMGISEIYAAKSPEEKVEIVFEESKKAKTAYLGDGVNDAPALVAASVGIAFGRNSDVTAEAAGAVVLADSLIKVEEFLHVSSRMRKIGLQSAVGGMALSIIGMGFAAFGFLPPVAGAISQEVIDVLAILNSLRAAWRPSNLTDMQ